MANSSGRVTIFLAVTGALLGMCFGETTAAANSDVQQYAVDQAHAACFEFDPFPSAKKCQNCHPGHYREWPADPSESTP